MCHFGGDQSCEDAKVVLVFEEGERELGRPRPNTQEDHPGCEDGPPHNPMEDEQAEQEVEEDLERHAPRHAEDRLALLLREQEYRMQDDAQVTLGAIAETRYEEEQ